MKLIEVFGDDYAALDFGREHEGMTVSEYIKLHPRGEDFDADDRLWTVNVLEMPEPPSSWFVEFVRNNIQDYDDSKHHNFWLEGEVISA